MLCIPDILSSIWGSGVRFQCMRQICTVYRTAALFGIWGFSFEVLVYEFNLPHIPDMTLSGVRGSVCTGRLVLGVLL